MTAAQKLKMPYAEYLAAEETSEVKHDYLDGEVFAMTGGTLEHSLLSLAFASVLRTALAGRRCRVFESNARIRRLDTNFSCYPDASVVCGKVESAGDDEQSLLNPVLIVEVLSASTESYDRGEKSRQYRGMPSVKEFVFVSQHQRFVEVFRRNPAGRFELFEWTEGDVELLSVDVRISLQALYADAESIRAERG